MKMAQTGCGSARRAGWSGTTDFRFKRAGTSVWTCAVRACLCERSPTHRGHFPEKVFDELQAVGKLASAGIRLWEKKGGGCAPSAETGAARTLAIETTPAPCPRGWRDAQHEFPPGRGACRENRPAKAHGFFVQPARSCLAPGGAAPRVPGARPAKPGSRRGLMRLLEPGFPRTTRRLQDQNRKMKFSFSVNEVGPLPMGWVIQDSSARLSQKR